MLTIVATDVLYVDVMMDVRTKKDMLLGAGDVPLSFVLLAVTS